MYRSDLVNAAVLYEYDVFPSMYFVVTFLLRGSTSFGFLYNLFQGTPFTRCCRLKAKAFAMVNNTRKVKLQKIHSVSYRHVVVDWLLQKIDFRRGNHHNKK